MSKSTLSITVQPFHKQAPRTIEVPCRLPEAFNFIALTLGGREVSATAYLSAFAVDEIEIHTSAMGAYEAAEVRAESILAIIKATLGIIGPVPPGSPLPAIALAYEADVAAYEAQSKAMKALPMALRSIALMNAHPSERVWSGPVAMLSKYVEHVVQNAAAQVAS